MPFATAHARLSLVRVGETHHRIDFAPQWALGLPADLPFPIDIQGHLKTRSNCQPHAVNVIL